MEGGCSLEGGGSRTAVFSRTGRPPDTGVGGCSLTTCTVGAMLVQCYDAEGVQRVNPNPNQKCEGVQRAQVQRCAWEWRRSCSYPRTAAEVPHSTEVAGAGWRGRGRRLLAPLGSCESHWLRVFNRSCPKLLQQRPSHTKVPSIFAV
eukprot:scaffold24694_cov53-Phaeocystis_antarctica.AAC.2